MSDQDDLGVYRLCLPLGRGGMGEVWLAHHPTLKRLEVVKTIRGALDVDEFARRRFVREAQLIAQTAHPNLVRLYDFGEDEDGRLFYSMEYICGVSLQHLLLHLRNEDQRLDPELALWTIAEAAAGLHHAHEMKQEGRPVGLVHRDVTPHNLMLSWDGEVKVVDFGVAGARTTTQLTAAGSLVGKLRYMSPEQARGESVDRRCDVFALGAVLYEMVSGRFLHERVDAERIAGFNEEDLDELVRGMESMPAVQKILRWALAPQREQRLPTAKDLEQFARQAVGRLGPADDRMRAALGRCLQSNFRQTCDEVRVRDASVLQGSQISDVELSSPGLRSALTGSLFGTTNSDPTAATAPASRRKTKVRWVRMGAAVALVSVGAAAGWLVASRRDAETKNDKAETARQSQPILPGASALPNDTKSDDIRADAGR